MSQIIPSVVSLVFKRVAMGSTEHVMPILIGLIFGSGLIYYSNKKLTAPRQNLLIHVFAVLISLTVIIFHLHKYSLGNYNLQKDLPLYLCSLLAIIMPIFTHYRKYWMFEILVFWIIAGTFQAILTPDIAIGFPSFDYLRYWAVHLGLMVVIFYAIFVYRMAPTFKSIFKSILAIQVYVLVMIGINYLLNANYFYLNQKPKSASLLDYFGEWPLYIFVVQLILIPYFLIIYLPFYIVNRYSQSIRNS